MAAGSATGATVAQRPSSRWWARAGASRNRSKCVLGPKSARKTFYSSRRARRLRSSGLLPAPRPSLSRLAAAGCPMPRASSRMPSPAGGPGAGAANFRDHPVHDVTFPNRKPLGEIVLETNKKNPSRFQRRPRLSRLKSKPWIPAPRLSQHKEKVLGSGGYRLGGLWETPGPSSTKAQQHVWWAIF